MLPLLGALSSGRKDIARPMEPRGVPFAGAADPSVVELPRPLPLPLGATFCSALTFRLGKSSFGDADS